MSNAEKATGPAIVYHCHCEAVGRGNPHPNRCEAPPVPHGGRKENGLPEGELPRRGKRGHPGVRRFAPRNDAVTLGWSFLFTKAFAPPLQDSQGRYLPFPRRKTFIIHNRENFWHFRRNSLILFHRYCIIGVISERAGTCPFGGLLRVSEEGKGGRFSLYPFAGPTPFSSRGETTWENSLKP